MLILTKLQRWCRFYTSTRPKTRIKSNSDKADIDYIIEWLRENKFLIAFDSYSGRSRTDLLKLVRIYWDKKLYDGDEEFSDIVKEVLTDSDLNDIMKAQEEEGNLAEKALNVDDAPPAEEPISKLTQEFSDMGKGVLVDIKDLMKPQEEGHFVGEVLATSELTEHFSNVAEEVLLDSNPKDIQKGG